jgi:hypothetical protein
MRSTQSLLMHWLKDSSDRQKMEGRFPTVGNVGDYGETIGIWPSVIEIRLAVSCSLVN